MTPTRMKYYNPYKEDGMRVFGPPIQRVRRHKKRLGHPRSVALLRIFKETINFAQDPYPHFLPSSSLITKQGLSNPIHAR